MLNVENNQDIKRKGEGYRPKKSKIFTRQNIDKFIAEAPDDKYLMFKVVTVIGILILGACRREEFCQRGLNNIEDLGNTLVVNIPDSKTRVSEPLRSIYTHQFRISNVSKSLLKTHIACAYNIETYYKT
ncbi:hypothetical protein NQ317_011184 [Molorchus minor]|uniref:Tyr recombinase domain-containing protein n=1 Tax=Molorchus minor TaxID=1323400 RepID=A0ABQ9JJD7_9CUCU|nr:hypothetical protein NQ317_011184 [Molorchus minor]